MWSWVTRTPWQEPPPFHIGDLVVVAGTRHACVVVSTCRAPPRWALSSSGRPSVKPTQQAWWLLVRGLYPLPHVWVPDNLPSTEMGGRSQWVEAATVSAHSVVANTFPLLLLPAPALARVIAHLPVHNAAALAPLCRQLHAAFCSESSWRERCATDLPPAEQHRLLDWRHSYRLLYNEAAYWRVRVTRNDGSTIAVLPARPTHRLARFLLEVDKLVGPQRGPAHASQSTAKQ